MVEWKLKITENLNTPVKYKYKITPPKNKKPALE